MDWGYSLEPPSRGGSNEYLQSMFWAEIENISKFLSENFQFLEVKFTIYLIRRVFVMGAQPDLNLLWVHMTKGTLSHITAQMQIEPPHWREMETLTRELILSKINMYLSRFWQKTYSKRKEFATLGIVL